MNILRLVTSFKGNESQSYQLGNKIVEKLKNQLPITNIVTRNLAKNEMPHLNEMHFTSFMTPTDKLSDELKDAVSYSDQFRYHSDRCSYVQFYHRFLYKSMD